MRDPLLLNYGDFLVRSLFILFVSSLSDSVQYRELLGNDHIFKPVSGPRSFYFYRPSKKSVLVSLSLYLFNSVSMLLQ